MRTPRRQKSAPINYCRSDSTGLPVTVPATVVRARRQFLRASILVATHAETVECLLSERHLWFRIFPSCRLRPGFRDPGNAVIPGLVAAVTASNRLTIRFECMVAGNAVHCFELTVTLVAEGYRTKLGRQRDHRLVGWGRVRRGCERRRKRQQKERDPVQPNPHNPGARNSNEHAIPPCSCWAFRPTR